MGATFPFVKGHGTENDFVVLADPDGSEHGDLDPALVRVLCDRRTGIGADGVLRAVRSDAYDDPAAVAARGRAEWFMDYRNADGSVSEMCGNGIRVFARFLTAHLGVRDDVPLTIGTRDGLKTATFGADGLITVDMGTPGVLGETKVGVGAGAEASTWAATRVSTGNPHAVAFVDDLSEAGDLRATPSYDAEDFPDGVNVEFVVDRGPRHIAMRVHERGSGETRSCGTGACAAAVAAAVRDGADRPVTYLVDVPGGSLRVEWTGSGRLLLTGPVALVAQGVVRRGSVEHTADPAGGGA